MIFISYARRDAALVLPMVQVIRASGESTYLDQVSIPYGSEWAIECETAIENSDRFFLFWSKAASLSEQVKREWERALDNQSCRIVPLLLDKTPLPSRLAKFHGTADLQFVSQTISRQKLLKRTLIALWVLIPLGILAIVVPKTGLVLYRLDPQDAIPISDFQVRMRLIFDRVLGLILLFGVPAALFAMSRVFKRRRQSVFHNALAVIGKAVASDEK